MSNPGHAQIAGAIVYYLYNAPADAAELKKELTVLQTFVAKWNANDTHKPPILPSATKSPPPLKCLLITADNHKSDQSAADQPKHISAYIANEANWAQTPHERGPYVYIFSVDEDPGKGYKEYSVQENRRRAISAPAFQAALANAEAKDLGTLGQGALA
ncbi:hypothetical protein BD414DRAFT_559273 [Trametes punicea]|nr:hypothetical protein BD414DRAFT_559273 [Trametes punicea]